MEREVEGIQGCPHHRRCNSPFPALSLLLHRQTQQWPNLPSDRTSKAVRPLPSAFPPPSSPRFPSSVLTSLSPTVRWASGVTDDSATAAAGESSPFARFSNALSGGIPLRSAERSNEEEAYVLVSYLSPLWTTSGDWAGSGEREYTRRRSRDAIDKRRKTTTTIQPSSLVSVSLLTPLLPLSPNASHLPRSPKQLFRPLPLGAFPRFPPLHRRRLGLLRRLLLYRPPSPRHQAEEVCRVVFVGKRTYFSLFSLPFPFPFLFLSLASPPPFPDRLFLLYPGPLRTRLTNSILQILFMVAFAVLSGPTAHLKHIFTAERLPFTAAYFGSLIATLFFALVVRFHLLPFYPSLSVSRESFG